MLAVSTVFMTQPIFLEISESFKIDITQARFSFSMVSLFYAASFLFIGPAVDKYSFPMVAVAGLSFLSLMVLFASYINHFGLFNLIMGLIGFCAALIPAAMFPYVTTTAPQSKVGLYVGSIVASATLGVIFGRVSMGVLTSVAGWRFSFRIFTIVMILFLFVTFFSLVKNQNKKPKKTVPLIAMYKNSIILMLDPAAMALLLAGFALFFGFLGMITFLTYRLTEPPFSFSAGEIGWISFAGLTAIIAPFSGNISQKTGIFKIIFPGLLVCLLSLQFMGWFESVFLIALGLLFLFLGVYSCQPLIFLLIGKNVPRESIGSASSLYIFFCIGGGSLSSIALGPVWDIFGWPGITVACTFSILISLLLMIATRIKKTTEKCADSNNTMHTDGNSATRHSRR
jgi:YNFM family putative membrane transporter